MCDDLPEVRYCYQCETRYPEDSMFAATWKNKLFCTRECKEKYLAELRWHIQAVNLENCSRPGA